MENNVIKMSPTFTLMESYSVLAVSTAHLTKEDTDLLHAITHHHPHALKHQFTGMIMERDTGYFIKLYEENYLNEEGEFSASLHKIIQFAHDHGHRMIEFDADAPEYPELFERHPYF